MIKVEIKGEQLILLPEKAIHWPNTSSLFIADLHLGKSSHFRKEGIGVPESIAERDYENLNKLLLKYNPRDVYLLGDLFHSEYNAEWSIVIKFIKEHKNKNFHLIIGNHDILEEVHYRKAGFIIHRDYLDVPPFRLIHEPPSETETASGDNFVLCGHLHPGIRIKGKGRQNFRLPCYYFKKDYAILPAFGTFTGVKAIKTKEGEMVYAIVKDRVVQINKSSLLN